MILRNYLIIQYRCDECHKDRKQKFLTKRPSLNKPLWQCSDNVIWPWCKLAKTSISVSIYSFTEYADTSQQLQYSLKYKNKSDKNLKVNNSLCTTF